MNVRRLLSAPALSLLAAAVALSLWPSATPASPTIAAEAATPQIVGLRRLTEAQYRNSVADIFGPDIRVAGRFEPIVRPAHELIASGAREAAISPAGLEQFDAIARGIAGQAFDEAHRGQFVPCAPKLPNAADRACAEKTLAPLARLIFRQAPSAAELGFYTGIANRAAEQSGSFHEGLELALGAMLTSPRFVYVVETAEPDPDHPGELRLDNASRAARLSFMLWNSTPNEALLRAAEAGELTDPAKLEATAQRMVDSPRFEQGLRAFFSDMLLFEKFDELAKDPLIYPYFNLEVLDALPEQTLRTITNHLLSAGGDYRTLFTTPRTVMTRSLGALYQVQVRRPKGWEDFTFGPQDDRAGLLGQAGFLALYSHSGRSSPTLRGKAIREVLMCQPVPNPPGNVNFTAVQDVTNKAMPTARIRLNAHNTDAVCAGCHKITDPAGLALERFDGIGVARSAENGAPIDVSGAMDGVSFSGATGLGKALAESPDTTTCVAARVMEYAAGRPADQADAVEALERRFAGAGYDVRSLFRMVAGSPETYRVIMPTLDSGAHLTAALR